MSDKTESANLILKLYDLRREEVMRKARSWFVMEFRPASAEDIGAAAMGPNSAYFRMVTSYWEMAASLVVNGAIDEQMFNDANGEHVAVYSKLEPFIAATRELSGRPTYMEHLEKVVMNIPDAAARMTGIREMLKKIAAGQAASA
jgi:hypothetical protein